MKQRLAPLFMERLDFITSTPDDTTADEPVDLLQMMMRYAQSEQPQELNLDSLVKRLCLANLSSMQQTTFAAINLVLDIIGSDVEFNTVAVLRDEVNRVLGVDVGTRGQAWTKTNFSKLVACDSVIRESMRLHSFGNRALLRVVMADGVRTEDGIELPKGSLVSVLSYPIHQNEDLFEDATKFDPLRYTRRRDNGNADTRAGNLSLVTTGPQFLPFGHGKHACPGRFLVDFELKMLITHLLSHYDVKFPEDYQGKRPPNRWITEASLPPKGVRILVKRRNS